MKQNSATRNSIFEEILPTVWLTVTNWPRTGDAPVDVIEFTTFGKAVKGK